MNEKPETKTNTPDEQREKVQKAVEENYEAFQTMKFSDADRGKFALLRDKEIVDILEARIDAHKMGVKLYEDGLFSVQEISPIKVDLGYRSYAL